MQFQRFWSVIEDSLGRMVQKAFSDRATPDGINHTLISLVPKVSNPETMFRFRPISCSLPYKTITKIVWSIA